MSANRTSRNAKGDPLGPYRAKRSLDRTPEPGGKAAPPPSSRAGGLFVVHMHAARRLHWDLRLEMDGVLKSWAVPKGPSPNRADKRLAVHVEDHPLEYGDFEGLIPEGNYGAGAVIVWDRGTWKPLEDPHQGMKSGKLLFELHGYKLKGKWALVKLKKAEKDEWLLLKEKDEYASNSSELPPESVLSGLTVEDLKAGADRMAPLVRDLTRLKAPKRQVDVADALPMLAESRDEPFSKPGWWFEPKLDGYRVRVAREGGEPRLITRNGHDIVGAFPEIGRAIAALPFEGFIFDGELVVPDQTGRPSFQRLQNRAGLRAAQARRAAIDNPALLYVFDVLALGGFDLRPLTLERRKPLLRQIVPPNGPVRYLDHFARDGEALYEQVSRLGLEGIVAKQADSPYRAGRSPHWLKIRADRTEDFVVVGFTRPRGSRSGFGALDLGAWKGEELVYAGRAGTGFSSAQLATMTQQLEKIVRAKPPFAGPIPQGGRWGKPADHTWVEPKYVAEVRFKEWTDDGLLRQPVFVRWRDDKPIAEAARREPEGGSAAAHSDEPDAPVVSAPDPPEPHEVKFSNLDKVFWPEEGYTKGDLIEYYRSLYPWLEPYLAERPVVLTRFPDGIHGKSFFQKDAPGFVPDWIRTERIWSEDTQRDIDYFICDNVESLVYLVNLGTIPLHVWASRAGSLELPDWCVIDLDPKEAPFIHVVTVARALRDLCKDIEMPCFVKTSGSSGLHVLLPLGRQVTYEQCRSLGALISRVITNELPDISTVTRPIGKRGARVYLDYIQNGHGRLLVAPYSARPLPGAPVSMPLSWDEVTPKLDAKKFTIRTALTRVKKWKADPVRPLLDIKPDLVGVLERLQKRLD